MTTTTYYNYLLDFPEMVKKLEYLGKQDRIKILHASFETGNVAITFNEPCDLNFKSIMDRIKFVEMSPRLRVKDVNFETGILTIHVLDADKDKGLTDEEINSLKNGKLITAIKSVRQRTGWGLADAKKFVEKMRDKLLERGLM